MQQQNKVCRARFGEDGGRFYSNFQAPLFLGVVTVGADKNAIKPFRPLCPLTQASVRADDKGDGVRGSPVSAENT